jgi:pseudaminic acid biosynthesis-associated methylase
MSTKQIELWRGPFGDMYNKRNEVTEEEIKNRTIFWKGVLQNIYMHCSGAVPKSILEVGAGQGPNLIALRNIYKKMDVIVELYGTEVNENAKKKLKEIKEVEVLDNIPATECMDLVFTYGVLIHTHPGHLYNLQKKIYNCSSRFIVCTEYFSPTSRPIPYRGENDALWADDYGGRWLDQFRLRVLGNGFCWKRTTGLDNVTVWMMEKMEKMQ